MKELSCNATNVKEFPEQVEQKTGENTTSEQDKQEVKKTKKATAKEPPITKIPELEEFAKKADSFEDFAKLVAKWLEMKNREEIFVSLIIATTKIDKIKWDILEETVKFSASDRQIMAQSVKNKLKEYSVSILTLLKILKEYSTPFYQLSYYQENLKSIPEKNLTFEQLDKIIIGIKQFHSLPHSNLRKISIKELCKEKTHDYS